MGLFLRSPQRDTVSPVTAAAAPISTGRAIKPNYSTPRSLAGSASPVDVGAAAHTDRPYAAWQAAAWIGYEQVGEIHYGVDSLAKLLSRVRIYAGAIVNADDAPVAVDDASDDRDLTDGLAKDAQAAVAELVRSGFPEMMRAYCLNISIPGECYLIRMPDPQPRKLDPTQPDAPITYTWVIRSVDEVQVRADRVELITTRSGGGTDKRSLPRDTYIARMWKANPRYSGEPDSSMIGIADAVEELLLLSRVTRATARSRLSSGILFVPDSITAASVTQPGEEPNPNPGGDFLSDLMDSIITPISDEGSAAGVVPMMVTGPSSEGDKIRHITFQRPLDAQMTADKERALERVLQGLDIPKEIVTGLADVKYSNALVIDENMFKANVEPLALLFVDSMTTVYLRPVLRAIRDPATGAPKYTEEDLQKVCLWYDPSEIVTQPDAAADATEGYNLGLLSGDAWRKARGFGDGDAPDEAELAYMMVTRASTQIPEETLQTLLQRVFPELLGKARADNIRALPTAFPPSAQEILQPDAANQNAAEDATAPAAATAASGRRR